MLKIKNWMNYPPQSSSNLENLDPYCASRDTPEKNSPSTHFLRARRKKIAKIRARRKKDEAGQFVYDWERKKGGRR